MIACAALVRMRCCGFWSPHGEAVLSGESESVATREHVVRFEAIQCDAAIMMNE